ncbi:MAG TPA: DUF1287 domain-containing protein [Stellaceae bacterium]|nr:DUF1287 domain-containing protein [Stellaceae bacterium]
MRASKFTFALLALLLLAAPHLRAETPSPSTQRLIQSAYAQIGVTLFYDSDYHAMAFPGGDVPAIRGVCSDVIIRAYRGIGTDLQLLVNQDMRRNFQAYPKLWGLAHPDPNIDHRRVPNLATFFARHGRSLTPSANAGDYLPGDIVTWRLPGGAAHIGLVSDRSSEGKPLIIHNIGAGAAIEDILFAYPITGHYRYLPLRSDRPKAPSRS